MLTNGTLFPLAALAIVLPLFLPIAVAVIAGDSVAGEAQAGTLRYLLVRPVGRTRLLVAKLVVGHGVRRRSAVLVVAVDGVRRRHAAVRRPSRVGAGDGYASPARSLDPAAARRRAPCSPSAT